MSCQGLNQAWELRQNLNSVTLNVTWLLVPKILVWVLSSGLREQNNWGYSLHRLTKIEQKTNIKTWTHRFKLLLLQKALTISNMFFQTSSLVSDCLHSRHTSVHRSTLGAWWEMRFISKISQQICSRCVRLAREYGPPLKNTSYLWSILRIFQYILCPLHILSCRWYIHCNCLLRNVNSSDRTVYFTFYFWLAVKGSVG